MIRTDCFFFLLRINFCDFQKINQYPALIIFSFLLITCKKKKEQLYYIMHSLCKTSNSLYTVLFVNERGKLQL